MAVKSQNQVTAALRPSFEALAAQLPAQERLSITHAASRAATPFLSSPPPSKRISPTNPPVHSSPGCGRLRAEMPARNGTQKLARVELKRRAPRTVR